MGKFKTGQKVKVKNLGYLVDHRRESPSFHNSMARYADTIQEIEKYLDEHDDLVLLKDVYDRNRNWQWRWNENWLEPIVDLEVDTDRFMNLFNIEGEYHV